MDATPAAQYASQGEGSYQLTAFQQGKVLEFLKLVKWIVARLVERLPQHIDADDLMHSGVLGLIDAVHRFKWGRPKEGEEFKAYAECRIRGRIMDELRQMDVLPRSARERVNHFKKAIAKLQQELKREPGEYEICEFMKIDMETCHQLRAEAGFGQQIPLDAPQSDGNTMEGVLRRTMALVDPGSPEARLHVEQVKRILVDEIGKLQDKERQVIALYYYEELTLKEIGLVLEVSESRISQVRSQAVKKLMRRLKSAFGSDTPTTEAM